jgi:hypothetical protein
VYRIVAASLLLIGASVADYAVPMGQHEFASALVHLYVLSRCHLSPLLLGVAPPPFRPSEEAEAEAPLGQGPRLKCINVSGRLYATCKSVLKCKLTCLRAEYGSPWETRVLPEREVVHDKRWLECE